LIRLQEVEKDTNMLSVQTKVNATEKKESANVSRDMKAKLVVASLVQTIARAMVLVNT
jgi:hypothetical protein